MNDAGESSKEVSLKTLSIRVLRRRGFGRVCKGEPTDTVRFSIILSQNILSGILLGINFYFVFHLGLVFWQTVLLTFASLVVLAVLMRLGAATAGVAYFLYFALWSVLLGVVIYKDDLASALLTFGVPFLIVSLGRWALGAVKVTRHIPFFVPLALIFVLLPLLTEDPWRLASASGSRIAYLALCSSLPLVFLLVLRIWKLDFGAILNSAVEPTVGRALDFAAIVRELNSMRANHERALDVAATTAQLADIYSKEESTAASMRRVAVVMQRRYKWVAIRHFLRLLSAVGLSLFGLIYVLAWVAVPRQLATEWSASSVAVQSIDFFGGKIDLPLGPYLFVSLLLATVAFVGFLGFTLTEDQHSATLWNGVAVKPAEDLFLYGIPYLALREPSEADADPSGAKLSVPPGEEIVQR
ncbi:hypothetical protein [Asanoa hainanensis]|nr:hypothetical protein [Asanoa hainanensis]